MAPFLGRPGPSALAAVALVACTLAPPFAGEAGAQGLDLILGGSEPGAGTLVEREDVAAAAEASFLEALVARGEEALERAERAEADFTLGPHVADAQRRSTGCTSSAPTARCGSAG